MRIKIQNIIIPDETCQEKEPLYFIKNADVISYATYFNCLSVAKWKKYTEVGDIKLHLFVTGQCELSLKNFRKDEKSTEDRIKDKIKNNYNHSDGNGSDIRDNRVETTILHTETIDSSEPSWTEIDIPENECEGIIGFEVKSPSKDFKIISGYYDAEIPDEVYQEVNLALNICTYKREKYITDNLNIISKEILNNPACEIRDHVEVYVQDNGHTLDIDELCNEKIHIVYNKNNGGAAGFTRGMIEVIHHIDSFPATHIIMMDDDIEICTESIFRTYSILTCRKKEYEELTIGGAMFGIHDPTIMIENGATWDSKKIHPNSFELRMDSVAACVECEIEEKANYNAWWYCCVPMTFVKSDNLPIPIFVRGDDIEYGLRNMKSLLVMSGICVWHEEFGVKYSSSTYYYIHRNMLIDNALHFESYSFASFVRYTFMKVMKQVYTLRYKNARLLLKATQDYLKGIDFVKNVDSEQLHKEITNRGDRLISMDDISNYDATSWRKWDREHRKPCGTSRKLASFLTINGTLLPAIDRSGKGMWIFHVAHYHILDAYREKRILFYEESTNRGVVFERNRKEAISILLETVILLARSSFQFGKVNKEYRNRVGEITTENYWKEYLKM